jgi:hypothetical protein
LVADQEREGSRFATLQDAGDVASERPVSNRRGRARVRLTGAGRAAFEGHGAARPALVATADVACPAR